MLTSINQYIYIHEYRSSSLWSLWVFMEIYGCLWWLILIGWTAMTSCDVFLPSLRVLADLWIALAPPGPWASARRRRWAHQSHNLGGAQKSPGVDENKVGQRTQKQDGTQHTFLKKTCGVGSCALHEIGVRSLLKHRAHWWYQGPQFTTACCVSYVYILLVAIFANVINSSPSL